MKIIDGYYYTMVKHTVIFFPVKGILPTNAAYAINYDVKIS